MMKTKKKVAALLVLVILATSFGQFIGTVADVHAETTGASTETVPTCDSTCHRYTVTGATNGTYANGVLTVPSEKAAFFTSDLPGDTSAYYISMTLKSAGNINLGYRSTNGKYFQLNKSGYYAVGNGSWQNSTAFADLASGVKITLYSSTTELKVWAGEKKILDEAYADSGNAKPGIQWSNKNEVTVTDICIWTTSNGNVPVYDEKQHVLHKVTGVTTGYTTKNVTYENGVLSVEAGANAYLTSDLPEDASYYASMTVKSDKVSISARNKDKNYFLFDALTNSGKGQYHAPGIAGANWVNPATAIFASMRNEGINITYYSTPDHLTVWVDGSKLIDGDYTGTKGNATPGISWAYKDTKVSNIKIWTERPETAPVCDSTCHRYTVTGASGGTYENGVLTVPSGTGAFLTSDLPGTASAYYMSMTLKSAGNINLGYRATTGKYLLVNKSGYQAVGNGSWQNSAAFANLASGVKITLYSSTTELKVWAGEKKILDETYADSGNAKPGIQWSNNHEVTMSDICIWTKGAGTVPVYDEKQHVLHEVTGVTTGYTAKNVTYENGVLSVEAGANGYLTSDLPKNASYYASMTVKSDKVGISARNTDKNYFLFDALTNSGKGQYHAPGIASANWVNPTTAIFASMRNEGINITYYSTPDHLTVWVNGSKLIDDDYTGVKGETTPGISWAYKDTKVSNIRIWTVKVSDEPVYGATDESTILKYDLGSESLTLDPNDGKWGSYDFDVTVPVDETYYVTYTVQSEGNIWFNFRGVGETAARLWLDQNQYYVGGVSEAKYTQKAVLKDNARVRVTIKSMPDKVTIWLNGEKIKENVALNEAKEGLPRVGSVNKAKAVLTDVKVWKPKTAKDDQVSDEPVYDPTDESMILKYELESESLTLDPKIKYGMHEFDVIIPEDETYYVTYTAQSAGNIWFNFRGTGESGARLWLDQNQYYVGGVAGGGYTQKALLRNNANVRVTIKSMPDKVTIWLNGVKIKEDIALNEAKAGIPKVSGVNKAEATLTDIKIWKPKTAKDEGEYLGEILTTPKEKLSQKSSYDVTAGSQETNKKQENKQEQPIGKNVQIAQNEKKTSSFEVFQSNGAVTETPAGGVVVGILLASTAVALIAAAVVLIVWMKKRTAKDEMK